MDREQGWTCGAGDQGWVSTREEGESRFPERPSTPALGRNVVPSSFPPVHPNQVLPGSPRRAPARVRDTRWQCRTVVPLLTPHSLVAVGCSGAPRPLYPSTLLLPQLATTFTALGLFGYPKIKLSISRRTHPQQITDGFPGGLLVFPVGAVKCDAPGAFSASSVHVLQLWEYEEKVPQKTAVFF